jgi:hypothetical protein
MNKSTVILQFLNKGSAAVLLFIFNGTTYIFH